MIRASMTGERHEARASVGPTDELVVLWQQDGDRRARNAVVERFLPLARRLAGRYSSPYEPMEDLVQVASVGLLGAIDRFQPERGASFTAFAVPTILGELKRYFRDTGWSVHVPRGAQETALKVDRASREITAQTGRVPRAGAIADHLKMSVDDVLVGLDAATAHYATSLDAPASRGDVDEPRALVDTLGDPDEGFATVDTRLSLTAAMTRLPYVQRRALSLRIDRNMRQADIARHLGCSQMQVSRLLRQAARGLQALTDPDLS